MSTTSGRAAVLALCLALVFAPVATGADAVWGTSTAELSLDDGFVGYWKYCFDIGWDTTGMGGSGMSHVTFFLALAACECACEDGLFLFAEPAGSGTGDGGCPLSYGGSYLCKGDPTFPGSDPTIKYEYYGEGCEPGRTGSAHVCFYSAFGPGEPTVHAGALGIKAGTATETGDLNGVLPPCECGSSVEEASWGVVKALFR